MKNCDSKKSFILKPSDSNEVAYLQLPRHPGVVKNCVAKSIEVELPDGKKSEYDITFDYDHDGNLIGIEFIS